MFAPIAHPFTDDGQALSVIRCAMKVGEFPLLRFYTSSETIKQDMDSYCVERGFTPGWSTCSHTGHYIMTKTPMALLVHVLNAQPNEGLRTFVGAWQINMSPDCTALNLIANCTRAPDSTLRIDKFTLFYPFPIAMHAQEELCEPGFRTSMFKGNIDDARRVLQTISLDGIVVNLYEDTLHTSSDVPKTHKVQVLGEFVQHMLSHHKETLQASYTGDHETLLEDEFALIQRYCQPNTGGSVQKVFAVSVVVNAQQPDTYHVEPYPNRCTSVILRAIEQATAEYPSYQVATCFNDCGEFRHTGHQQAFWIDDTWEPTNYYGGYVKFIPCPNTTMLCGFQATKRGGTRMVFPVTITEQDTSFPSPVDGKPMAIPSHLQANQDERPQWFWHSYDCEHHGSMLSEYRQLPPQDWTPYQSDVSAEIEATYQSGDASCHILVGAVSLEICLKTGNLPTREMGIQKHGHRVHFVKRMFVTSTDYDRQMRMFNESLREKQSHALGNVHECAICLESLTDSKCVLLHCNHLMHALCLQAHVEANGSTCPVCKTSTMHGASSSDGMHDSIYSRHR